MERIYNDDCKYSACEHKGVDHTHTDGHEAGLPFTPFTEHDSDPESTMDVLDAHLTRTENLKKGMTEAKVLPFKPRGK